MKLRKVLALQLFAGEGDDAGNGIAGSSNDGQGSGADGDSSGADGDGKGAKYTDADVDKLFERKFAEMQRKHQKEVDEAKKLAEMNAQERLEHEKNQLQEKLNAYEKSTARAEMSKIARGMLEAENIAATDDLLELIVSDDAEGTKKTVDSFIKAFNKAVDAHVKKVIGGEVPKKSTGKKMTKEQILAVKDTRERQKLITENIDMFR